MILVQYQQYYEYETLEGDTWDSIALDFYTDEFKANILIESNPNYANVVVFPANIILKIPIIAEIKSSNLPPWKR